MSVSRGTLLGLLPALATACQLEVAYDGRFSCSEPPHTCPDEYFCSSRGECLDAQGNPPPGGPPDAAPSDQTPDAGTGDGNAPPTPGDPDAGRITPPDPDASTGPGPIEVTFGERGDATHQNVTFDTFVKEDQATSNFGGKAFVLIDALPQATGLIQFDIDALPIGARCVQADLVVSVNDPIEDGEYQIFAVLEPWSEGNATFNRRNSNNNWTTPGAGPGSRAGTPMATTAPRNIGPVTVSLDCAVVDGWIQDPSSNHGMAWIAASPLGRGGEFRSSEDSDASVRPLLRLQIVIP